MKLIIWTSFVLTVIIGTCFCNPSSTTKEVPLYIRQSWVKVTDTIRSACVCKTGVNPTVAFKAMMEIEVPNNPCLKRYIKCVSDELNLIDASTGEWVEKEFLRQIEGCTPEVFAKCNEKTKNEVDLDIKAFDMYMCIVHKVSVPKSPLPSKSKEY